MELNQQQEYFERWMTTRFGLSDSTALHAAELGFRTHLIEDASRGVNLQPNDVKNAIEEVKRAGVGVAQSGELLR